MPLRGTQRRARPQARLYKATSLLPFLLLLLLPSPGAAKRRTCAALDLEPYDRHDPSPFCVTLGSFTSHTGALAGDRFLIYHPGEERQDLARIEEACHYRQLDSISRVSVGPAPPEYYASRRHSILASLPQAFDTQRLNKSGKRDKLCTSFHLATSHFAFNSVGAYVVREHLPAGGGGYVAMGAYVPPDYLGVLDVPRPLEVHVPDGEFVRIVTAMFSRECLTSLFSTGALASEVQTPLLASRGLDPEHFLAIPPHLQVSDCRESTFKVPLAVLQRRAAAPDSHPYPSGGPLGLPPSIPAGSRFEGLNSISKPRLCVIARTYGGYGDSQTCAFSLGLLIADPSIRLFIVYNGDKAEAEQASIRMRERCRAAAPQYTFLDVSRAMPPEGSKDYGYIVTNAAIDELVKLDPKADGCDYFLVTNMDNSYFPYYARVLEPIMRQNIGLIGYDFVSRYSMNPARSRFQQRAIDLGASVFSRDCLTKLLGASQGGLFQPNNEDALKCGWMCADGATIQRVARSGLCTTNMNHTVLFYHQ